MAITFDEVNQLINLTAPETDLLLMQDLINAIRVVEASEEGIQYGKIADGEGKVDIGGGVVGDITITLLDSWQIKHAAGYYQALMKGGQVVGGLGGNPIAYVTGVQVKMIQSVAGVISTVSTGSGLDATQDAYLTTIHSLLSNIENNLDHQESMKLLLSAMVGKVSGAETTAIRFRDTTDTIDRITATVDENGNRTVVNLDVS